LKGNHVYFEKHLQMDKLMYKTISANESIIRKDWVLIDAEGEVLGRLASKAAKILRGKNKVYYTPHRDCGDNVIIINAEKVTLTGLKWTEKQYIHHTGYPGGQRFFSAGQMMKKRPTSLIEEAIRGMLPKNRLGREIFRNLHVYAGAEHPHQGQNPKTINLKSIK
jgi:large subunit ribosomal protein L13